MSVINIQHRRTKVTSCIVCNFMHDTMIVVLYIMWMGTLASVKHHPTHESQSHYIQCIQLCKLDNDNWIYEYFVVHNLGKCEATSSSYEPASSSDAVYGTVYIRQWWCFLEYSRISSSMRLCWIFNIKHRRMKIISPVVYIIVYSRQRWCCFWNIKEFLVVLDCGEFLTISDIGDVDEHHFSCSVRYCIY